MCKLDKRINLTAKKNNESESDSKDKKRIKFFTSFEEAEASEIAESSKLTPLERLANTNLLIKKLYNYKPQRYYRIIFDKV